MTARVAEIWRHPIKSHGRESLARVTLREGRTMPWDRRWAVAHDAAKADGSEWAPCQNFSRGAKAPRLQAISARSIPAEGTVTLTHPERDEITINPDDAADQARFIDWVKPISPTDRALPDRILRVEDRGMTDTDYPSISILNAASHAQVADRIGREISINRWRGNLVLEGLEPWAERGWIGQRIKLGGAVLEVREEIVRCLATTASTRTGERDADTLNALMTGWGHKQFGVYAEVVQSGEVQKGDPLEILS
ncbi:MOSC domain-containing protein [Aliiroseovarius sp.]|uniref:MOSC domain-containing protein n=1 Tax=Aliiroseovarius sp. TaxID=1872442 RepID=UPI003BA9E7BA